jgi:His/Glu/Gln/Arg/opine family amino acid ABC transporter permease subunit
MTILQILTTYRAAFLDGLWVTVKLAGIVWILGILIGSLIGVLADRFPVLVGYPTFIFTFFLSGIPLLVLLFWAHFPLQVLLRVVIDPFITACWVLTLVNTFTVSEIVKNVLHEFPEQYVTAAKVCGLDARDTMFRIKLPITLRQMLPPLLTSQVNILQATLFASLISVNELFRVAQRINASVYQPVPIYSALALFFLMICLPLNGLALWLKARFTRNLSER